MLQLTYGTNKNKIKRGGSDRFLSGNGVTKELDTIVSIPGHGISNIVNSRRCINVLFNEQRYYNCFHQQEGWEMETVTPECHTSRWEI